VHRPARAFTDVEARFGQNRFPAHRNHFDHYGFVRLGASHEPGSAKLKINASFKNNSVCRKPHANRNNSYQGSELKQPYHMTRRGAYPTVTPCTSSRTPHKRAHFCILGHPVLRPAAISDVDARPSSQFPKTFLGRIRFNRCEGLFVRRRSKFANFSVSQSTVSATEGAGDFAGARSARLC